METIERINLVNNFEIILDSKSLTATDRESLCSRYGMGFTLANITFAQIKGLLAEQSQINQYQALKQVFETFEEYTNRGPNRKFAGISLKHVFVENPSTKREEYQLHFVAHFNENVLKSLNTSQMYELQMQLSCYIEESRLGKWCNWEQYPSSHCFQIFFSSVKGAYSDDQTFDICKRIEHELDAINFIRQQRENLRIRFNLNIFGRWRNYIQRSNKIVFNRPPQPAPLKLTEKSILQALFENDSTKDIKIRVDNGIEIKAHKCILAAQSNVFETMLTTKMKQGSSDTVHIDDISEDAMTQLIRYFYGMEIVTVNLNCKTACELFQAAHKYKLKQMETAISALFILKDEKWFTVHFALELYFYTKNISEAQNLNNHLLRVLSRFPSEELRAAEKFKELPTAEVLELTFQLNDMLRLGK